MADKVKVIDALRRCAINKDCRGCPYKEQCWSTPDNYGTMFIPLLKDALELLERSGNDDI